MWKILFISILYATACFGKTHYDTLHVHFNASVDEIKKSYRSLAIELHPDKVNVSLPEEEKEAIKEEFLSVQEAYEILSDPYKRMIYHATLAGGGSQGMSFEEEEFSPYTSGKFFTVIKTGQFTMKFQTVFPKPPIPPIYIHVQVYSRSFFFGGALNQSYLRRRKCSFCGGTGGMDGHCDTCTECNGTGVQHSCLYKSEGKFQQASQNQCPHCHGRGCQHTKRCPHCAGTGALLAEDSIDVVLPTGFNEGLECVYENRGHETTDGRRGNAILYLHYALPPNFSVREIQVDDKKEFTKDLLYNMTVPIEKFIKTDSPIHFISVDGAPVSIQIPPNMTRNQVVLGLEVVVACRGLLKPNGHYFENDGQSGAAVVYAQQEKQEGRDNGDEEEILDLDGGATIRTSGTASIRYIPAMPLGLDVDPMRVMYASALTPATSPPPWQCENRGNLIVSIKVDWNISSFSTIRKMFQQQVYTEFWVK